MKKELFAKNKLSLAIALCSSAILLTGCGDDTSKKTSIVEDASRSEVIQQQSPTADVFGVVQDTNGKPIKDATASIGGISDKTDSRGAYHLKNVPVTGFNSTIFFNENGAPTISGGVAGTPLQVSVKTSSKYLDATVSVTPISGQNMVAIAGFNNNGSGEGNLESENSLMTIVLADGVAVSAGLTVVPEIRSTVTGVLRDATTGLVIPDTVVALELLGVSAIAQEQGQTSTGGTGYSATPYYAKTNDDGEFKIKKVPEDAVFNIVVEDWNATGVTFGGNGDLGSGIGFGGDFSTTPEVTTQNIGDVMVSPMFSVDGVNPFVTRVDGVVTNAARAILNDDLDGTQGIVIHFNEPLTDLVDENSVFLVDVTAGASLAEIIPIGTPVLSTDRKMLTVTTTAALSAGTQFDVNLQVADFEDEAENGLVVGAGGSYLGKTLPAYDVAGSVTTSSFVALQLQIHQDPILNSLAVTNATQVKVDPAGTDNFSILNSVNINFSDNDFTATTSVLQLNDVSDTGVTGTRLQALGAAILANANIPAGVETAPASVQVDRARVHFDIATATTYNLSLKDVDGITQTFNTGLIGTIGNNTAGLALANHGTLPNVVQLTVTPSAFNGPTVEVLLDSISPNDVLTIASVSSFGTSDASASLTLVDQIAPTTVLQNSYGVAVAGSGAMSQVNTSYGDGGELSSSVTSTFGAPYLNVTPFLLTPQANTSLPLPRSETWDTLKDLFETDITNATSGDLEMDTTSNLTDQTAYNATAIAGWSVGSRTVGVAFSEEVAVDGTGLAASAGVTAFTTSLTGFVANANVLRNDQDGAVNVDLVNVVVADVIALANDNNGRTLDFTGFVSDPTANTSATADNAKVIMRDLMPPIATSAVYNGDSIVVTYNENVSLRGTTTPVTNTLPNAADVFTLRGTAGTKNIAVDDDNADANQATTTVTLNLLTDTFTNDGTKTNTTVDNINKTVVFDRGTFDDDNDASTPPVMATGSEVVSILEAESVRDTNGINWSNWDTGSSAPGTVDSPVIVITDATGAFSLTSVTPTTFTATSSEFTVAYLFSHRVDLGTLCPAAGAGALSLTATEVAGCFTWSGGAIDTDSPADDAGTVSGATISTDGKTITVTVNPDASATVTAADTFAPNIAAVSAWDPTLTAIPTTVDDVLTLTELEGMGITAP
jgi:hypothetical protein